VLEAIGVILVVSVALLVPATVLVLVTGRRRRQRRSKLRPFAAVLVTAIVMGAAGATIAMLGGEEPAIVMKAGVVVAASVFFWRPIGREWAMRGLVAWALTVTASLSYLAYTAVWTAAAGLSAGAVVGSILLWLVELFVIVIGLGHLWEFIEVLTRRQWPGTVDPRKVDAGGVQPFVSLHVPTHNEPPEMVIATLQQLLKQRYENYEIFVIDNNTTDPALWRPVEAFCAGHDRIKFLHVEDLEGFKSGALNLILPYVDPRTEVIGIIDADYLVRPDFLADCAPMFAADPGLSFLQTPQDYRDWDISPYFRRLYYSYGYFFDVSQVSRNERNGAIFGGTMGLIRRSALEGAGGWDEWCITEDAELSLRLLREGGRGIHVDRSYGHGIMPLTFEALKKQRFRWCFGGVQILRMHWRSLLPGRRTEHNQLTLAQRWAYLVGGLQWFGDLASLFFTGFLLLGAADAVFGSGLVIRRMSGLLLLCVVALVVLGLSRAVVLARRSTGASWGDALGAYGLWLALGWVVAVACVRGLFERHGVFLRTPKQRGELRPSYALRANLTEVVLGAIALGAGIVAIAQGAVPAITVGVLLCMQAVGYFLAPANSLAAIRSSLPDELVVRRRYVLASWETARWGGAFLVAGAAVVVIGIALAEPDLPERPRVGTSIGTFAAPFDDRPATSALPDRAEEEAPETTPVPSPAGAVVPDPAGQETDTDPAAGESRVTPTPATTPTSTPGNPAEPPAAGNAPTAEPTQAATSRPAQAATPEPTRAATPAPEPSTRPTAPGRP
jgi:cellulose synthase/poly-beta-1,6-N-acetylglucosamine synthase-like glycosyltransferase